MFNKDSGHKLYVFIYSYSKGAPTTLGQSLRFLGYHKLLKT